MTDRHMKKIAIYALAAIAAAAGITLIVCKGGEKGGKAEAGPEAVVETFTRHVAAGEFSQALALCDTSSMRVYIDDCINTWNRLQDRDSSVLSIASGLLKEAEFKVERTEKTETGRNVYYCIEAEGCAKKKKASVIKEEGEWRVRMITDVI